MLSYSKSASFQSIPFSDSSSRQPPRRASSLGSIRSDVTRSTVDSIASRFSGTTQELLDSAAYLPDGMPQGEGPDIAQARDLYYRRLFHVTQAQRILEGKGRREEIMDEEEKHRLYEVLSFLYPSAKNDGFMHMMPGTVGTTSHSATRTTTALSLDSITISSRSSTETDNSSELYSCDERPHHSDSAAEDEQKRDYSFIVQREGYVDEGHHEQIDLGGLSNSSSESMSAARTPPLPPPQLPAIPSSTALPAIYFDADLEKGEGRASVKLQKRSRTSLALFILGFICPWFWAINGWIWGDEELAAEEDEKSHLSPPFQHPQHLSHFPSLSKFNAIFQSTTYPTTNATTSLPDWLIPPLAATRSSLAPHVPPVVLLPPKTRHTSPAFLHNGDRWIYASRWAALISTPLFLVGGTTLLVLSLGYRVI